MSPPSVDGDRRRNPDRHLGRRATDAWFPYNTAFVAQALAQNGPASQTGLPSAYAAPAIPGASRAVRVV